MNMEIITLDGRVLAELLAEVASGGVHTVRVARDGDTVKIKVNEGCWSPGYPLADEDVRRRLLRLSARGASHADV